MAPVMSTAQKPSDCLNSSPLMNRPPHLAFGGHVDPAFGFAAALIAIPACAKYHAADVVSIPQKVAVAPFPPPKSKRLPCPTFDGASPSGISFTFPEHAEAVSSAPMENSMRLCTKPVTAPAQSSSKRKRKWGTSVWAQFDAARERLAAIAAMDAMICSTFTAQIGLDNDSPPPHVLAASLMLVAIAASCVVACRASNVQEATVAFSAGSRSLNLRVRWGETASMRSRRPASHFPLALPIARETRDRASEAFAANSAS
mmetsp:Transcript_81015/g.234922  ORF Transcript_81015/g.234922 Transcript_81015/m.234922 type:complete len:258 (-) Transcript_81015:391-1164(-)